MSASSPAAQADGVRDLLLSQFDLAWGFGSRFVLDRVDDDLALWEPSDHVATVHRTASGWVADWPDEEHPPLPEATVGWLLWHIEFWWGNAADAVEGLDDRRIDLAATRAGDRVIVTVRDRGPGVPDAIAERIFDPFFSTKGVGKGLGLGLSISYNIVKDFGGALTVERHPEGGTLVRIDLQTASVPVSEAAE